MGNFRIGHGYDVHALAPGLELWLGGIKIEHEAGCIAHSDGDVVIHALCDALLGAAALGDIGLHFPDTSDDFKGIDSKILVAAHSRAAFRKRIPHRQCGLYALPATPEGKTAHRSDAPHTGRSDGHSRRRGIGQSDDHRKARFRRTAGRRGGACRGVDLQRIKRAADISAGSFPGHSPSGHQFSTCTGRSANAGKCITCS